MEDRSALLDARERAARTGLLLRVVLLAIKATAAALTGSIGILADAIHGTVDLSGAAVGYVAVRVAGKPPDEEHSFGHQRAEDIAAATIAVIIFLGAAIVAYEAISRLTAGPAVHMLDTGIAAEALVVVIKLTASRRLLGAAKRLESIALEAMGRDFEADVLSSGAVLVGLILARVTGRAVLDPIAAVLVVGLIIQAAYSTMRKAISNLMDTSLPPAEERAIREVLQRHDDIQEYHALRTRKAGSQRYVDMHIVVGRDRTVEESHGIADAIEEEIRRVLPGSSVITHVEPCAPPCDACPLGHGGEAGDCRSPRR